MKLGFVTDFASIYKLYQHRQELEFLAGFGKSSISNILDSIEVGRTRRLENIIVAIGIPGVGKSSAKTIAKHCMAEASSDNPLYLFIDYAMNNYDWSQLEDFGKITSDSINRYVKENLSEIYPLVDILVIDDDEASVGQNLFGGKSFCITGKLEVFTNRGELVAEIEKYGGKIVSGVTAKTNYLITNDKDSGSSKNQKAIKYGTQILSEKDFIALCLK